MNSAALPQSDSLKLDELNSLITNQTQRFTDPIIFNEIERSCACMKKKEKVCTRPTVLQTSSWEYLDKQLCIHKNSD